MDFFQYILSNTNKKEQKHLLKHISKENFLKFKLYISQILSGKITLSEDNFKKFKTKKTFLRNSASKLFSKSSGAYLCRNLPFVLELLKLHEIHTKADADPRRSVGDSKGGEKGKNEDSQPFSCIKPGRKQETTQKEQLSSDSESSSSGDSGTWDDEPSFDENEEEEREKEKTFI